MLSTGSAFVESAVPTPSQEPFSEFAISAIEKGRALEGGSEVDNPMSRGMAKKRKIGEVIQINPMGREGEHMAKTDELPPVECFDAHAHEGHTPSHPPCCLRAVPIKP
jgi:hypothetical protein